MTSCFKQILLLAGATLAFTAPFYTFTSCTEVDDALGFDIIPEHQRTVVGVDTLMFDGAGQTLIKAFVTHTDTVYTTNQGYALMGNFVSNLYGHTRAATLMQFVPTTPRADTTGNGFGIRATVDSVKLTGFFNIIAGEGAVEQSFNVFQLADTLRSDTAHYANFDYSGLIDPNPIFTFKFKKEANSTTVLDEIKMNITPTGRIFVQRLIADTAMYNSNVEFIKNFYGIVVAPADNSSKNAAIFSSFLGNTFLDLYLHNYDENGQVKYTDVMQSFLFNDQIGYDSYVGYYRDATSVASIRHDYTGTDFAGVQENGAEIEMPNNYGYIQGMCGVNTLLRFSDEFFDAIENLKEDETDDIMISEAVLLIDLDNVADDVEVLHGALAKLGSYVNYSTWYTIPDYIIPTSSDSETTASYGGLLNLTHGYYELNVTTWLNKAIRGDATKEFTLAPTVNDLTTLTHNDMQWSSTVMKASASNPMKMRLTYILIK